MRKDRGFLPAPMPVEDLRKLLAYNRETGLLTWLVEAGCNAKRIPAGSIAGSFTPYGYIVIRIRGKLYRAHRVAWFLETGEWPPEEVDHEDLVRSHNWWTNLRLATHGQNMQNRKYTRPVSKSGFRGVSKRPGGWLAQINVNGKLIHFPTRSTAEEAYADYCEAAKLHHGQFARFD